MFVCLCSDCETFISADDLRINLWNLEVSDQSFNIVDIKPVNMEDLTGTPLVLAKYCILEPWLYSKNRRGRELGERTLRRCLLRDAELLSL